MRQVNNKTKEQKHMAKQTKSAVAPATNEPTGNEVPAGAPAAPKKVNIKEPNGADRFKRVLGADGKGVALVHTNTKGVVVPLNTPQVKIIANTLEAAGETGMSRKELCDALPGAGLVTRQPIGRIVSYYQKDMIANGAIEVVKAAPVAEAPAA